MISACRKWRFWLGQTASENILLMEQRQALLATQAVGARELSRKGIGDAQAAVAQVSGISRQEGVKNVFVRGLGDRYNVTLLNGFAIPSEDPQYKNIALEFFGTDIIQNISVNKVFSSSDYSDVGGASINIISKELVGDRALSLDLSGGVNSAAAGSDFYDRTVPAILVLPIPVDLPITSIIFLIALIRKRSQCR